MTGPFLFCDRRCGGNPARKFYRRPLRAVTISDVLSNAANNSGRAESQSIRTLPRSDLWTESLYFALSSAIV